MNEQRIDIASLATSCFRTEDGANFVVDEPSLREFWDQLSPADDHTYDFFVTLVGQQSNPDDPTMNARAGGWVYHLSSGLVKGALLAFVVTAALKSVGATDLSVAILPAVLPFLFDLERTKLSRRQEQLLITLHSVSKTEGKKTSRELYDLLPEEIQRQVNFLDFEDFIDAINLTGHVSHDQDGRIEVSHPNNPKLRIILL